MRAVVQRTAFASVTIGERRTANAENKKSLLVLLAVTHEDTEKEAAYLAKKIAGLRIFTDENGKMNLSLSQLRDRGEDTEIVVVSQFTLYADCKGQNRPSFLKSARPDVAVPLYELFVKTLRDTYGFFVETGEFGADMQVSLLNDGPVTIIMDTDEL